MTPSDYTCEYFHIFVAPDADGNQSPAISPLARQVRVTFPQVPSNPAPSFGPVATIHPYVDGLSFDQATKGLPKLGQ